MKATAKHVRKRESRTSLVLLLLSFLPFVIVCGSMTITAGCRSEEGGAGASSASKTGQANKSEMKPPADAGTVTVLITDYLLYSVYVFSSSTEVLCSPDAVDCLRRQITTIEGHYELPIAPKTSELIIFPNPEQTYLEISGERLLVPHIGDEWFELLSCAGVSDRGKLPSIEFKSLELQLTRRGDQFGIEVRDGAQARLALGLFEQRRGQWVLLRPQE